MSSMKKPPTAAASRAALARRRQRVLSGNLDFENLVEGSLEDGPLHSKRYAKKNDALSSAPTPTKSNVNLTLLRGRNLATPTPTKRSTSLGLVREKSEKSMQPEISLGTDDSSGDSKQFLANAPKNAFCRELDKVSNEKIQKETIETRKNEKTNDALSDIVNVPLENDTTFHEDPEPSAEEDEILDATCLHRSSSVSIKSFVSNRIIQLEEIDTVYLIGLKGGGLGNILETFEIHPLTTVYSDNLIRYGRSVLLYSPVAKAYLGVRSKTSAGNDNDSFELGFFRRQVSDIETWTILHGDRTLLIGSAVQSVKEPSVPTSSVRVGECFVLRNNFIGGLLSVTCDGKLSLVTQSYHSNHTSRDALIDRVLRHYEIFPSDSELFQFRFTHTPPCPTWTDLLKAPKQSSCIPFEGIKMNIQDQERMLLDDMIGSLMGLNCNLIRREKGIYRIIAPIEANFQSLINRVLPIATGFYRVFKFLEKHRIGYEFGLVMQALCEEMDNVLEEYLCSIEFLEIKCRRLETATLTLNHILVEIQQLERTIKLLQYVIDCAQTRTGGCLLNGIRELEMVTLSGDAHMQALLNRLLRRASMPWMHMLSCWLVTGNVLDPCEEFMVVKNGSTKTKLKGDNWQSLFSVRRKHVFKGAIASKSLEEQVLTTGKYWNAVHQCESYKLSESSEIHRFEMPTLLYTGDPSALSPFFEAAHERASSSLFQLLIEKYKVKSSLLTIKRYFLLDQGDFLVHFMDSIGSELAKPIDDVSIGRAQHCLSLALHLTDPTIHEKPLPRDFVSQPLTSQCIRCFLAEESLAGLLAAKEGEEKNTSSMTYGLIKRQNGMSMFSLEFAEIPFPSSLILSNRNMSKYQILFRHIFYAKHVEQRLVDVWLDNQMMKEFQSIRGLLGSTLCLRHRMLHFVQNFIYYMMLEVIEPNWQRMIGLVAQQKSADDLIKLHDDCLQIIMEDCLLTNPPIYQSLSKLLSTCLMFSEQIKRFVETIGIARDSKVTKSKRDFSRRQHYTSIGLSNMSDTQADKLPIMDKGTIVLWKERKAIRKKQANFIERELKNDTYQQMIKRQEQVFDERLCHFMGLLRTQVMKQSHINNLCIRLDYNGYISSRNSNVT